MPPSVIRHYSRVKVELELTPSWWRSLTPQLTSKPEHAPARALLAQAVAIALELPTAQSVRIERACFAVVVTAPHDCSTGLLAQAAETCRDKLHSLDISCLGETTRAKFLT